ncbi:MAG: prepilin signal peptidase PulO-like [Planctomycetota bacterium]|nr:MAG: prepilin signal peptidase PulO-like [Planctomycetota bacterium]
MPAPPVMPEVPDWFWIVSAAVMGGTIGSFLNVCIYRMPRRCMSVSHPRHSHCPRCGHSIRWYENIPVISWVILLRGRCSSCRNPISPMYPFIEALTAAFFALAAMIALEPNAVRPGDPGPSWLIGASPIWDFHVFATPGMRLAWFLVAAWFAAGLIVSTFVDFEFRIIPDQVSISGMWLAPAISFVLPWLHRPILRITPGPGAVGDVAAFLDSWPHLHGLVASLLGAAVAAGAIWMVGFFGKVAFRKEAMGFGDVKLMAWIGGLIGWKASIITFLIASCLGAGVGVPIMAANRLTNAWRAARGKQPIPFDSYLAFGPYLAAAGLAMFLWYSTIDDFAFNKYPKMFTGVVERLVGEGN